MDTSFIIGVASSYPPRKDRGLIDTRIASNWMVAWGIRGVMEGLFSVLPMVFVLFGARFCPPFRCLSPVWGIFPPSSPFFPFRSFFWESTCFRDFPLNAGNCSGRNFPSPSQIFRPYFRWGWWMGETLPSSSTISSLFRDFPLSGSRRSSKNPGINSGRNSVKKKKEEKKIRVISRAVSEQSRICNLKRAVTEQFQCNISAFSEQSRVCCLKRADTEQFQCSFVAVPKPNLT